MQNVQHIPQFSLIAHQIQARRHMWRCFETFKQVLAFTVFEHAI